MKYQPFHTVFLIPELSETSVSSFSQALQRKPLYNHASAHPAALGMTPQPNKNPTEESPAGSFFWAGQSFPTKLRNGNGQIS